MNKRILELAFKLFDEDDQSEPGTYIQLSVEKFAELIVRECIEQVWYTREDGINGNVSEVIKERMKQHFGVEE